MNIELLLASLMLSDWSAKIYLSNHQLTMPNNTSGFLLVSVFNDQPDVNEFAIKTWFPGTAVAEYYRQIPSGQVRMFVFSNEDNCNPVFWVDGTFEDIFKKIENIWDRLSVRKVNVHLADTARVQPVPETLGARIPVRLQANGITSSNTLHIRTNNGASIELTKPDVIKHLLAMTGSVGSQQEVKPTPSDKPIFNMAPITVMPDYIKEAVDASVGALSGSYRPLISILRADKVFWPPVYRNTRKPILFAVLGETGDIKGQQLTTIGVFGYEQLCEKLAKYKNIINSYLDGKIAKPTISMIVANLPQMVITQKLMNYLASTVAPLKEDNILGATNRYGPLCYNLVDIVEITDDGVFIDLINPPVEKGSDDDVSVATTQQDRFVHEIIGYSSRTNDPTSQLPPKVEIDNFFIRRPNIVVKENMKKLVSALYYQYYGLCVKNGVNEETLGKIMAWVMWNSYIGPQQLWDEAPVTFDVSTPHNATEPHQAVVEVSYPYNNIRNFKGWSLRADVAGEMHYKLYTMFSRYTNEKIKEILQGNDCYEIRQVFRYGKPTCAFKLVKV